MFQFQENVEKNRQFLENHTTYTYTELLQLETISEMLSVLRQDFSEHFLKKSASSITVRTDQDI